MKLISPHLSNKAFWYLSPRVYEFVGKSQNIGACSFKVNYQYSIHNYTSGSLGSWTFIIIYTIKPNITSSTILMKLKTLPILTLFCSRCLLNQAEKTVGPLNKASVTKSNQNRMPNSTRHKEKEILFLRKVQHILNTGCLTPLEIHNTPSLWSLFNWLNSCCCYRRFSLVWENCSRELIS